MPLPAPWHRREKIWDPEEQDTGDKSKYEDGKDVAKRHGAASLAGARARHGEGDGEDGGANAAGSGCGSGFMTSDWGDTIQRLNSVTAASSPSLPLLTVVNNTALLARSPTNSSSSTASSSASSSPPISAASSRQLLSEAAAAIANGNHIVAASLLSALKLSVNPQGDAEQRLVAMMVAALSSCVGTSPSQHLADLYIGVGRRRWSEDRERRKERLDS
uniref:Scarecrow transcriptional regulator-like protein n=1 Tax=Oryza sativa subsp. japonica TaxID=39947 RepID=Q6ER63_ORYSJ|nr:scarecrow transcriptional regulator-like protein [Oryza sativa Japonica Group]